VPGTFRQQWVLVPNPNYAGKTPRPLQAACHDGSPSDIVLRELRDEYACPVCVARLRAGLDARQESLL
jgi:hypothetical protein